MSKTVNQNYRSFTGKNDKRPEFRKFENRRNNMECSYCHGTNHTKDRCYNLIGFPPRVKSTNSSNDKIIVQVSGNSLGNNSTGTDNNANAGNNQTNDNSTTLSSSQYQQLLNLLNQGANLTANSNIPEIPQSGILSHSCS